MTYRIAATLMTLSDFQGYLPQGHNPPTVFSNVILRTRLQLTYRVTLKMGWFGVLKVIGNSTLR